MKTDRYYGVAEGIPPSVIEHTGPLPSVTSITSRYPRPALQYFYGKHGTKDAEALGAQAAGIGTQGHELFHRFLTHQPIDLPEADTPLYLAWQNFLAWWEFNNVKPVCCEEVVWSAKHQYAGRIDCVAWVNQQLSIIDFKTSKALYADYSCQLVAYAEAFQESSPFYAELSEAISQRLKPRLLLVHCSKTAKPFEVADVTDRWTDAWQTFLALRQTFDYTVKYDSYYQPTEAAHVATPTVS